MPREKGAAPLDLVIAVMAFLAALTLGASLLAERAATGWRQGLADRLTVQIVPLTDGDAQTMLDSETGSALGVLRATPGIARAAALSNTETGALVEPWLGKGSLIAELPLPRLIDATIVPGADVDLAALSRALRQAAPHAVLDDHSRWMGRLKGLADTIIWSAYGILALIAVATASIVAFATRAGLEAHHEMVALLHQMGAQAGFIARAFERHYFVAALLASLAGAALAGLLFLAAGGLEFVGIEAVPFLPPLALKITELPWLAAVPAGAALIAFVTARLSVLAALRDIY
jgi:cell division transport system permease protein